MPILFVLAALVAAFFVLPGGGRRPADRKLAQLVAFAALAAALFSKGLGIFGAVLLLVGGGLFGIGWLKDRLTGEGFQDLSEDADPSVPPSRAASMDQAEALSVLGLSGEPSREDVLAAHRRMIQRVHPDAGGSDYLAGKINTARDLLMGRD